MDFNNFFISGADFARNWRQCKKIQKNFKKKFQENIFFEYFLHFLQLHANSAPLIKKLLKSINCQSDILSNNPRTRQLIWRLFQNAINIWSFAICKACLSGTLDKSQFLFTSDKLGSH